MKLVLEASEAACQPGKEATFILHILIGYFCFTSVRYGQLGLRSSAMHHSSSFMLSIGQACVSLPHRRSCIPVYKHSLSVGVLKSSRGTAVERATHNIDQAHLLLRLFLIVNS